jgi:hypothetical protein
MKLKFLALLAGFVFLTGCSLNDDENNYCYDRYYMAATAVTGPETTTVNTPVVFNVTFSIAKSCGVFFNFVETNTGFPKNIAAAVDYTGCNCDQVSTTVTKPYTFKATTAGTYTLHFLTEDEDAPIVKTVVVTE